MLVATLLSASCASSRVPYTPPSPEAPPAFKENANWKAPEPRDSVLRGAWWEVFGDVPLNALESQIDISNQTLKGAEGAFAQARALVRGARAGLYPQVTAAPAVNAVRQSGNRAFSSFHDPFADILAPGDVSYEADVWGRVHSLVETNRTAAQASAADLETIRLSVHSELALDYFMLRGLDREEELLVRAVDAYERALELTQNRFRGGLVSQADVALAETQLESTRAQAVDIGVARAALEHAIALLVGQTASTFAIRPSPLLANPPDVPTGVPSDLLERRADVAGAERRLASANAQVGVTTAAYYPLLMLSGAAGFESSSFGSLLASASTFWTTGPAALITVFDAGKRRSAIEQARAGYDQAFASYREVVLSSFREVEDQLSALRILDEESKIQQNAVDASERSLTLATNRYRGGVTSYLEVITAQSAALSNERTAVEILTRRMSATVLLLKGLGGTWTASQMPAITGK